LIIFPAVEIGDERKKPVDGEGLSTFTTYFPWVVAAISPHFPATRATGYASP
jgi:hypothetical protein